MSLVGASPRSSGEVSRTSNFGAGRNPKYFMPLCKHSGYGLPGTTLQPSSTVDLGEFSGGRPELGEAGLPAVAGQLDGGTPRGPRHAVPGDWASWQQGPSFRGRTPIRRDSMYVLTPVVPVAQHAPSIRSDSRPAVRLRGIAQRIDMPYSRKPPEIVVSGVHRGAPLDSHGSDVRIRCQVAGRPDCTN